MHVGTRHHFGVDRVVQIADGATLVEYVGDDGVPRQQLRIDFLLVRIVGANRRDERARTHHAV